MYPDLRTGLCLVFMLGGLAACGSGSSSGTWVKGVFPPANQFAEHCPSPRTGTDPYTGRSYSDVPGTVTDENNFLRSWIDQYYLWYREVPDLDPSKYTDPVSYFALLKTSAVTPSGPPKDRFHFTYSTPYWESLSLNNVSAGYGLQWQIIQASGGNPPQVLIAYLEPQAGTPASNSGLVRGDQVLSVDGVAITASLTQDEANIIYGALFPASVGESHSFTLGLRGGGFNTLTLTSIQQDSASAFDVKTFTTSVGTVGYLQSNDESATGEADLANAVSILAAANGGTGVQDLIVDMRYNGGGFLDVANEFAYMVAGPAATGGKTFYRQVFNDKYTTVNPITGNGTVEPFISTARGYSLTQGTPLPTLNLSRVFVLTGPGTCSAAEAFINGLRGVGVTVIQVGSTSCGKPYGFYPQEDCGTTYFAIQFQGYNDADFGAYPDGFSPADTINAFGFLLPGCSVADDFTHDLGDPNEALLATALSVEVGSPCPVPTGTFSMLNLDRGPPAPASEGALSIHRPFWQEMLIVH